HAYFLLGGDPKVPIIYEVDRIRDGKSFTTRRVAAIQHGHSIFAMAVSFHGDEPGMSHQWTMPKVPRPDELPTEAEFRAKILPTVPDAIRRYYERERPSCAPSSSRVMSAARPRAAISISGSARRESCRTSRRSINACSPTPPT